MFVFFAFFSLSLATPHLLRCWLSEPTNVTFLCSVNANYGHKLLANKKKEVRVSPLFCLIMASSCSWILFTCCRLLTFSFCPHHTITHKHTRRIQRVFEASTKHRPWSVKVLLLKFAVHDALGHFVIHLHLACKNSTGVVLVKLWLQALGKW